jgi:hypothetical protein
MHRHVVVFSIASVALVTALLLVVGASLGFDTSGMGTHGWVAMVIGVVLTFGLAIALMGAVFASDSSGHDARVGGRGRADE